jgi:hypothetical protein
MQAHSGLVVDANAMLATLKHQLNLLDKQIRMLSELADAAPVLHREQDLGDRHEKADFVVVHQQRMREIVDQMKQQVQMIKIAVGAVSEGNA